MKQLHKSTLLYIIFALSVCMTSILILHHTKKLPTSFSHKETINSYAQNAIFSEYNQQGEIKTQITVEKMLRYLSSGVIILKKPFIITYTDDRTPVHIHADQAISNKSGDKIILRGSVIIHQLKTARQAQTMIKTTELTVFPKKSRAVTNKPITLFRPGIIIHSTGLTANLKTGRYQLLSNSSAVYTPNQFSKE